MNIICVGLNHRSAKVASREKFSVADHDLFEVSEQLGDLDGISESVILSTCNRVELYAATQDTHRGLSTLSQFLSDRAIEHRYDADIFYEYDTPHSIRHLFRVASGLESMVLGETEILGQVKKAYTSASSNGRTAKHLNKLFQRAFQVAKEVRTNTRITSGSVSVGSATVDLAEKIFGNHLKDSRVMILGVGETGEMVLRTLRSRGVSDISVCNRSSERAEILAAKMEASVVPFGRWEESLDPIDILICSTASPTPLLNRESLGPIMRRRAYRPLFIIDLAVPRDVDSSAKELEGVYLHDLDSIQAIAKQARQVRHRELARCEEMIEHHTDDFLSWLEKKPQETRSAQNSRLLPTTIAPLLSLENLYGANA